MILGETAGPRTVLRRVETCARFKFVALFVAALLRSRPLPLRVELKII